MPDHTGATALDVRGLTVTYEGWAALVGATLTLGEGEVLELLGPSGSGKSTFLYAVAGFQPPAAGEIRLHGQLVASAASALAPEERDIAFVFQNYALWPHMSVLDTVAYAARRRRTRRGAARAEAMPILERLGIGALAQRQPAELSGGEQQRVGLARALARHASLYLFDEPTAHLDTQLRNVFIEELLTRQRDTGAAAVYATHNAEEALSIADAVALLDRGVIVQIGTPEQVYAEPVDLWAARLTGPASVLTAPVVATGVGTCTVLVDTIELTVSCSNARPAVGSMRRLLVRPGWSRLGGSATGTVEAVWFRGPHTDYLVETAVGSIQIREAGTPRYHVGEPVQWSLRRSWLLGDEPVVGEETDVSPAPLPVPSDSPRH